MNGNLEALPGTNASRWLEASRVSFEGSAFSAADFAAPAVGPQRIDFRNFILPGPVSFAKCTFTEPADFSGAHFHAEADFTEALFASERAPREDIDNWEGRPGAAGDAKFGKALFHGQAIFSKATIKGKALFGNSVFEKRAYFAGGKYASMKFGGARFHATAVFSEMDNPSVFSGAALFGAKGQYLGETYFDAATFGEDTRFDESEFLGALYFRRATFPTPPLISGMKTQVVHEADVRLDLATIASGPQRTELMRLFPGLRSQQGQNAKTSLEPSETDVFVSYRREDMLLIEPLVRRLEEEGFSVWYDTHIPPGANFAKAIDERLHSARVVVVCWSPQSVDPECFVYNEATRAKELKRLLPVFVQPCTLPTAFNTDQTLDLVELCRGGNSADAAKLIDWIRQKRRHNS